MIGTVLRDLAFTAGSGAVFVYYGWAAARGLAARGWSVVSGEIPQSEIKESRGRYGRYYTPRVSYEYRVNGVTYSGWRVVFGDASFTSDASARERAASLQVGNQVKVYYNPRAPGQSVLEPGVGFWTLVPTLLFGVTFVILVITTLHEMTGSIQLP